MTSVRIAAFVAAIALVASQQAGSVAAQMPQPAPEAAEPHAECKIEPYPYPVQGRIIEACVQNHPLVACLCYLRELEPRVTFQEVAGFEFAMRIGQPINQNLLSRITEAQMECLR